MLITLGPELEKTLNELARQRGSSLAEAAWQALKEAR